eukprot:1158321-Pelagomonas_calceolata.AAC.1
MPQINSARGCTHTRQCTGTDTDQFREGALTLDSALGRTLMSSARNSTLVTLEHQLGRGKLFPPKHSMSSNFVCIPWLKQVPCAC